MSGGFQIVLHAHLPFVRHPENEFHLEENWLFEAISETYLPLLGVLHRLRADRVPGALTISFSQPLIAMLDDELLRDRFERHLLKLTQLCEQEVIRTAKSPDFHTLALFYLDRFQAQLADYRRLGRDLFGAFVELHREGRIEVITCVGTHGFLPLMKHDSSRRAQIVTSAEQFYERTGALARGMWMGECAYWPGVDKMLAEAGVRYTFVDTHAVENASARPHRGTYAPLVARSGTAFFARDPESSQQVWSSTEGYPGDFWYREFYRDLGFDLPLDTIAPYIHPDGIRMDTGVKYYRVTGKGEGVEKLPYVRQVAMERVREHARHFVEGRRRQVRDAARYLDIEPVITSPYDAELFGHWWFEGPEFLEAVLREAARHSDLHAVTPSAWMQRWPVQQCAAPSPSSWGENGYYSVWLNPGNAWIYPLLHRAEDRMQQAARRFVAPSTNELRALNQAARELLLAQSSDWAFIIKTNTAVDYAVQRTREHVQNLHDVLNALDDPSHESLDALTTSLESRSPIFPTIDFRNWR
jgi:1,4-alpha-glucan branching enzyme